MSIGGDKPRRLLDFRYDTAEGREATSVSRGVAISRAVVVLTAERSGGVLVR